MAEAFGIAGREHGDGLAGRFEWRDIEKAEVLQVHEHQIFVHDLVCGGADAHFANAELEAECEEPHLVVHVGGVLRVRSGVSPCKCLLRKGYAPYGKEQRGTWTELSKIRMGLPH